MKTILTLLFAVSTLAIADQERDEWQQIVNSYQSGQNSLALTHVLLLEHVQKYFPGDQEWVNIVKDIVMREADVIARRREAIKAYQAKLAAKAFKAEEARERAELRQDIQSAVDAAMWQHGCR